MGKVNAMAMEAAEGREQELLDEIATLKQICAEKDLIISSYENALNAEENNLTSINGWAIRVRERKSDFGGWVGFAKKGGFAYLEGCEMAENGPGVCMASGETREAVLSALRGVVGG